MREIALKHTTSAVSSVCSWARTFEALPSRVGDARRFLASILSDSSLTGDALICLSEIATNAVLHSNSGQPHGAFTVRVSLGKSTLRVEVEDQGGPWAHGYHNDGQSGRGLLIVSQLATTWDISGDGTTSRTVWFEMTHP